MGQDLRRRTRHRGVPRRVQTEKNGVWRPKHLAFRENAFSIRVARKCNLNASRSRTFYLHAPSDWVASCCLSLGTQVTQARTSSWPVSQVVGRLSFVEACVVRRQSCHWRLRLCTQSSQHVSSTQAHPVRPVQILQSWCLTSTWRIRTEAKWCGVACLSGDRRARSRFPSLRSR